MNKLLPFALALVLAGCAEDPQARLARAEKSFAAHDYRRAAIDIAAALQAEPDNVALLTLAARNHLAQGDGVAAQAALDKLAATGRKPADFALLAGEAALLRGQAKQVLELVEGENSAEGYRLRALAQLALGDDEVAASTFAAGDAAAGDKTRLLADHAKFVLGRGQVDQAAALSRQALSAGPQQLDALLVAAQVAVAKGDLANGLKRYDQALAAYPGNFAALIGRAGVLGDLGRKQELAQLAAQIAKTAPDDPQTAYLLARLAADRKDWKKVRDLLQPLESSLDGRDDAQVLYAQALSEPGQDEQALARLEPLVRRVPGNGLAALLLARAQLAGGDAKGAVATLKSRASRPDAPHEVLAVMAEAAPAASDPGAAGYAARAQFPTPQALGAELAKGDTALKAGNWNGAAVAYRKILEQTDGKNVLVLNNLAFAEQQLGNDRKALELALRALKLAPGNASVMDTAGWLLATTGGDRNRALALLRAAARKAPGNRTIAAHLAQAERG